jgi:hypothetical protein
MVILFFSIKSLHLVLIILMKTVCVWTWRSNETNLNSCQLSAVGSVYFNRTLYAYVHGL